MTHSKSQSFFGLVGTERIFNELNSLGIKTLADLDAREDPKIRSAYEKQADYSDLHENITGVVRHILMTNNAKSYFDKAWKIITKL